MRMLEQGRHWLDSQQYTPFLIKLKDQLTTIEVPISKLRFHLLSECYGSKEIKEKLEFYSEEELNSFGIKRIKKENIKNHKKTLFLRLVEKK